MHIIFLPGNSKRTNKDWIESLSNEFVNHFESNIPIKYAHWESEEETILDMEKEINNLINIQKNKKDFILCAKSAGSIVALKAIKEHKITPKKCIFLGFPFYWAKENNIDIESLLKKYNIPTLFIQKSQDPVISATDLKALLIKNNLKNFKLEEIPGNDHHYEDIKLIKKLILKFIT